MSNNKTNNKMKVTRETPNELANEFESVFEDLFGFEALMRLSRRERDFWTTFTFHARNEREAEDFETMNF